MSVYKTVIYETSTGLPKAELTLRDLTFSRVLSGCGQLTGWLSIYDTAATEDNLGMHRDDPDREITVFRDGVPVWNGPLTASDALMSTKQVQIVAREASWYLGKRTLEEDRNYDGDDLDVVTTHLADTYLNGKQATGDDTMTLGDDIVAAIPRWSVDATSLAGVAFSDPTPPTFYGLARHTIQECLEALANDPETGFEWRMDYATGSTRQAVHRTLVLAYPSFDNVLTTQLTERVLEDFGRALDYERGATRVHVIYGNGVVTRQSATAVANGTILTEIVDDQTDTTKEAVAIARAKDLRRLSRPPVRVFTATYRPGEKTMPFGFCDLGDTVPFEITAPAVLSITADTRRVIQVDVTPGNGSELVKLTFNDKLDDLGT